MIILALYSLQKKIKRLPILENMLKGIMNENILNNVLIMKEIVHKKLSQFKINKTHGDDGIASIVLKEISSEIKQAPNDLYKINV